MVTLYHRTHAVMEDYCL